jgi:hypothetical protein
MIKISLEDVFADYEYGRPLDEYSDYGLLKSFIAVALLTESMVWVAVDEHDNLVIASGYPAGMDVWASGTLKDDDKGDSFIDDLLSSTLKHYVANYLGLI